MFLKNRASEKRHAFILSSERKTFILKLPVFIQSSVLALYSSCGNCFILRVGKIINLGKTPTAFNWIALVQIQKKTKFPKLFKENL